MGSRNPDRVPISVWRARVETVADMQRERWQVISQCGACRLKMDVNLSTIARLRGPETSLWDRKAPCRRIGCHGEVSFLARVPGRFDYQPLAFHPPTPKLTLGQRAELAKAEKARRRPPPEDGA
jgi:hypothetical protein